LDEPEPSDAGLPVQVHQIEDAVGGFDQGTISEAKTILEVILAKAICAPEKAPSLIQRGFLGPRAASAISSGGGLHRVRVPCLPFCRKFLSCLLGRLRWVVIPLYPSLKWCMPGGLRKKLPSSC
jgi:hypothetical protein